MSANFTVRRAAWQIAQFATLRGVNARTAN